MGLFTPIYMKKHLSSEKWNKAYAVVRAMTDAERLTEIALKAPDEGIRKAAVEALLVSPIAIIVVAVSGIACYALPSQDLGAAVRLWRALLLLGGICAGLYGVALLSCLLAVELSSLESFGRSYTAPLSGEERFGVAALLVSPPLFARKLRDRALNTPDRRRQR